MDNNPNNQPPYSNQPQPMPPVTPFPPQQDANFIVPPPDPKKQSKILFIVSIVLGVLLLITIGVLVYLLLAQSQPTTTTTTDQPSVDNERPQKIVTNAKAALTKAFEKNPNFTITTTDSTTSPSYIAVDMPFGVASDAITGVTLSVSPTPYSEAYVKDISLILEESVAGEAGLKKVTFGAIVSYQDNTVSCQMINDTEAVGVSCANVADYENVISVMEPFAQAYLVSDEGRSINAPPIFNTPLPKISKKAGGYSNAIIENISSSKSPTDGFRGLFYAKDDNWIFWKGTNEVIACADFNTNDLQHAFEGDTCLDTAGQTTTVAITIK